MARVKAEVVTAGETALVREKMATKEDEITHYEVTFSNGSALIAEKMGPGGVHEWGFVMLKAWGRTREVTYHDGMRPIRTHDKGMFLVIDNILAIVPCTSGFPDGKASS